ncbi:hypothetical protein [Streptosporangium carneum]|uniref:Uncharacterized protein n=1 Tax=Streptosporangium carneum TaxID=47481 RepID=A0A9W6I3J8_9ACTN|nr:hypothetical protein [Streptosporangium carneum]GLK10325.1 hypothetical protein GCM10017600_37310 [Streptosporangium carneum]
MTGLRNVLAAGALAASVLATPATMSAQPAAAAPLPQGTVASVHVPVMKPCWEYSDPMTRRQCYRWRGGGY